MSPEILQCKLEGIIYKNSLGKYNRKNNKFTMSADDVFYLWTFLGEELGIDLSLLSEQDRQMLLSTCSANSFATKEFTSLLWLVYYSKSNHSPLYGESHGLQ